MPVDVGLISGLAVKAPDMVGDLYAQENMKRQAQMLAEQRAKMFADETEFSTPMNAFDNHVVKDFAVQKTKELGKWARENPDYRFNPEKQVEYRNRLRELKDNEHLNNGLLVDANISAMKNWLNDPKNADVKDDELVLQKKDELANYLKTGSTDGNTSNRRLFTWEPPEEKIDLTPYFKMYGEATNRSLNKTKYIAPGAGIIWNAATDKDKADSAKAMLANGAPQLKRWLNKYYKEYMAQNPNNPLTIEQYAAQQISPFIKDDEYKNFSYHVSDGHGGGAGGGRGAKQPIDNLFQQVAKEAVKRNGAPVAAGADGLHQVFVGKNGALNLNNSVILGNNGNMVQFNGGLTKDYSFSGSNVRAIGNNLMATFKARIPAEEFEQTLNKDVVDYPTFGTKWLGNTATIRDRYKDLPIKLVKGEDGKDWVEVEISKPLDYNNQTTHYAYNFGEHGKPEEFSSETNNGRYKVSPDGSMYQDTQTGVIYDAATNKPIQQ